MKLRRWICFLLCLVLTVCLCAPALADGELFFVCLLYTSDAAATPYV